LLTAMHRNAQPFHESPPPFTVTVEVVPPPGPDPEPVLASLDTLDALPVDRFSVASNPVAKPRMSALALCALIQQRTGRPATLHCTTRDHNRLSLRSLLWGARALGISTVLAATGDYVALGDRARTTTVRDVDIYALVRMATCAGLDTGVVLDPRPQSQGLDYEIRRLARKVEAGAQFAVTQPVYSEAQATALARATEDIGIPVMLGILPLRTARHAWFLHDKVSGISVPESVRERMRLAGDPAAEGVAMARDMLQVARHLFAGVCIMPPFDLYDVLFDILR
jgi:methylenetetrahydrofolate reductase (NADPH)